MTNEQRFEKAMYRFFRHIQDQIENMDGWMQYDHYPVSIDAYEFNRFTATLAKPSNAKRWHKLHEKYGTIQESQRNEP